MSRQRFPKGFTLIELLVVISIIALLISILLPALRKARESGKVLQCLSNCRSIAAAMHFYTEDYDGYFCPRMAFDHRYNVPIGESVHLWVGQRGLSGIYSNVGADCRYLNRYMYNRFLDPEDEVLYARCPSDVGTRWSNQTPYFEHTGSTYGQNAHRGFHNLVRYNQYVIIQNNQKFSIPIRTTDVLQPSMLVMGAEQGAQNYAWGEITGVNYVLSFHSPEPRFNAMFVDNHAAYIEVPKPQYLHDYHLSGPGWTWDEESRQPY